MILLPISISELGPQNSQERRVPLNHPCFWGASHGVSISQNWEQFWWLKWQLFSIQSDSYTAAENSMRSPAGGKPGCVRPLRHDLGEKFYRHLEASSRINFEMGYILPHCLVLSHLWHPTLSPFYRWENWGSEKVSCLPQAIYLGLRWDLSWVSLTPKPMLFLLCPNPVPLPPWVPVSNGLLPLGHFLAAWSRFSLPFLGLSSGLFWQSLGTRGEDQPAHRRCHTGHFWLSSTAMRMPQFQLAGHSS